MPRGYARDFTMSGKIAMRWEKNHKKTPLLIDFLIQRVFSN